MTTQYTQRGTHELLERVHVPLGWPRRLFVFTFGLLVLSLVLYVGLAFGYKTFLQSSWEGTEEDLAQLGSQVEPTTQENFVRFRSQIENLKGLLKNHVVISDFFPFLESVTHERTMYGSMDLSRETMTVKLSGTTGSYETLAAQLKMYEASPYVSDVVLDHSSANGGMVRFDVKFTISPEVFAMKNVAETTSGARVDEEGSATEVIPTEQ